MPAIEYPIAQSADEVLKRIELFSLVRAARASEATQFCGRAVEFAGQFHGPLFDTIEEAARYWTKSLEGEPAYWRVIPISQRLRRRAGRRRARADYIPVPMNEIQWQLHISFWKPKTPAAAERAARRKTITKVDVPASPALQLDLFSLDAG